MWSDGKKIDRKIVKLTDALALGNRKVSIPFDATGKKWVRFTFRDAADNGAWTQPIILK